MTAEIRLRLPDQERGLVASMRPRSNDRGNFKFGFAHRIAWRASMRPRSNDRGNIDGEEETEAEAYLLQ